MSRHSAVAISWPMGIHTHPLFRSVLAVVVFVFVMQALKSTWAARKQLGVSVPEQRAQDRLVVAHFMLGNTYPFTHDDWTATFDLAEDTRLDGFALNIGPEDWQLAQAKTAFDILAARKPASTPFNLFLSLDMTVLPSTTPKDAQLLLEKVTALMNQEKYLRFRGKKVLSTFAGHDSRLGDWGWAGFLPRLEDQLGEEVFFVPAFFIPPQEFIGLKYVDGCFAWNNAWSLTNRTIDLLEDEPFLNSGKSYMAAVSPVFSTHYGSEGEWAFNKNWIYCSDNLLLPTRLDQLASLPRHQSPDMIEVISWNDFGESHHIAPVRGAEPGSQAWTAGMPHEAFREMIKWFAGRWRDGEPQVGSELKVWAWWRTHPAALETGLDLVERPAHADWAKDLLNFVVLVPHSVLHAQLVVTNGQHTHKLELAAGRSNAVTFPFVPGPVTVQVDTPSGVVLKEQGHSIAAEIERYNFNMWSGSWTASV